MTDHEAIIGIVIFLFGLFLCIDSFRRNRRFIYFPLFELPAGIILMDVGFALIIWPFIH